MGVLSAKASRFTSAVREAHRDGGSRGALRRMGELAVAAVQYRGRLFSEWRFDRRLQIDTRGVVSEKDTVATTTGHRDGTRYEATRPRDFERLAKSLPLDAPPAAYTFIDLGCGKGRVLVLAADHGFGRIVGVEIDDLLVDAARANLLSVQARRGGVLGNVEVVAADAATYTLPLEPLVIYMYNPFGEQTVRDVAENVQRSWEQCPRPLLVVYYNPVHQHLLDAVPALRRVPSGAEFWSFFRAD